MIGRMRDRVSVQENVAASTKGVQANESWATLATVYGNLRPLSARELRVADQNREIVTHEVVTRYRKPYAGTLEVSDGDPLEVSAGVYLDLFETFYAMLPRYRLLIGGRSFDIRSVENVDFKNRITRMRVEEKV